MDKTLPVGGNCPRCERGVRFGHCIACGRCQNATPMGVCWNCMKAIGPESAALMAVLYVQRVIPANQRGPWPDFGPEKLPPEARRRFEAMLRQLAEPVAQAAD